MLQGKALDEITGGVVDACLRLHIGLGPGLLESVYETVLARDLERRGLFIERQKARILRVRWSLLQRNAARGYSR